MGDAGTGEEAGSSAWASEDGGAGGIDFSA